MLVLQIIYIKTTLSWSVKTSFTFTFKTEFTYAASFVERPRRLVAMFAVNLKRLRVTKTRKVTLGLR